LTVKRIKKKKGNGGRPHNKRGGCKKPKLYKTRHHKIPRSRVVYPDFDGNIIRISYETHKDWHKVFTNMTPFEAVLCVMKFWSPPKYFKHFELVCCLEGIELSFKLKHAELVIPAFVPYRKHKGRVRAWEKLFSGKTIISVIEEIISLRWSPPGFFLRVNIVSQKGEKVTNS